jgi:hypothetical protein
MEKSLDGFVPSLESFEITPELSMITTDGNLIQGHNVRLVLKDGSDIVFSLTTEDLQKLFFLTLKTLS